MTPRRVALVAGLAITTVLVWSLANGFLVRVGFRVLDSSFRERDALIEPVGVDRAAGPEIGYTHAP